MNESLKDQLTALGLAAKKPDRKPRRQRKSQADTGKGKQGAVDISLDQAYRIRHRQEWQQKERAAVQKREQERQRRQTNQRIKALIKASASHDEAADIKRNFIYKGRIRSVLATKEQIRSINDGSLGVVYLSGNYHLLASAEVEEVRQFAPDHVPDLSGTQPEGELEHPVPDDLIW